ncbi:MAG TPA: radical SAM protein [Proteobacteria bacterium]|nr:radical SAM protein [Pseudomonadota bacterium]
MIAPLAVARDMAKGTYSRMLVASRDRATLVLADLFKSAIKLGLDIMTLIPDKPFESFVYQELHRNINYPEGADFLAKMLVLFKKRFGELHPNVRKRFAEAFIYNHMIAATKKRTEVQKRLKAPKRLGTVVISPTMRCNLKCVGCYSANYKKKDKISPKELDRIVTELKEQLGIHYIVLSGGEPFLRDDLFDLLSKHQDVLFMSYTNGTLIYDKKLAPKLAELGNLVPCISVEGFAEETDRRRGKGVFKKIVGAMTQLRNEGVLFGFSATPMRHNNELLVSDEFVDFYTDLGCFIGWYFNYMPLGRSPDLSLMPTPEQRLYRYERVRELRKTKDILLADFWCDGALVGGCLSAGNSYFHINADGGIEPCVFNQFWVDTIFDKPLIEALDSTYYQFLRKKLRDVDNPLRPCPIIDRPQIVREAWKRYHPKPAQKGGEKIVTEFAKPLDDYAKRLKEIFDPVWERDKPEGYGPRAQDGVIRGNGSGTN